MTRDFDPLFDPEWVQRIMADFSGALAPADIMRAAIELACGSAQNGGGPFGAVLADRDGRIIEHGWNGVVLSRDSTLHAEAHCIRRAQRKFQTHDLGEPRFDGAALFSSCAPCIHCFGVIYWSGLKRVYAAASKADAEAAGFDEGPLTAEMWAAAQTKKGILYTPGFCAGEAALKPFRLFAACGGRLY